MVLVVIRTRLLSAFDKYDLLGSVVGPNLRDHCKTGRQGRERVYRDLSRLEYSLRYVVS